ncbi:dihydropteroate synthase [Haloarcula sp. 1CSR25-25]|uniref:dihydropteroate synthase n=1 Tax=Haloarcula sp. 1CSR25-25 TaxID=2862545 RepID=UPI0028939A63|nr:dihydropteroate synthase [Haloarcula sp. 1CSR25-25]MDT3437151.1 dihydropteroate synthase [Haloarcula sp. 1CSR25-25]
MQFHEAANFLFDLRRFDPSLGLETTERLLGMLENPHKELCCVQVAGSNGKGSTARMLERVLRETGCSVGLYTSPHLKDVRNRITVDGRTLSEDALVAFIEEVRDYLTDCAAAGDSPTFFEVLTALALWEFDRQDVDVAVLEVGLGGRYDATSVVEPAASAVTSVTLEHTEYLGDTVAEIARDQAQVAPANGPLVTATTGDALAAIRQEVDTTLTVGHDATRTNGGVVDDAPGAVRADDPDLAVTHEGRDGLESQVTLKGPGWGVTARLSLLGAHQATNAGVAVALARQVADPGPDEIKRGLYNARWPGRFEVMGQDPLVVLDGAHNPGSCARTAETLATFEYEDLHLVVGAMTDKDQVGMAAALADADHVTTCEPNISRAVDSEVLADTFAAETEAEVATGETVPQALADALSRADSDDCVLVAGSLYAVSEARQRWTRPTITKRVDTIEDARETLANAHVTPSGVRRMAGTAVHRVLSTRVQPPQARTLNERMLDLGGECSLSGVNVQDEEFVDVVLSGTTVQFKQLTDRLADAGDGLGALASDLRATLDIQQPDTSRGYPWEEGTAVMGILNITPDSFHDRGEFDTVTAAVERAERMVEAGADILDVGGESTRSGANPVPVADEIDRVVPVIERLAEMDAFVSVDTRKAAVARAALDAGADILNDVSGLEDPGMRHVAADYDVPVVVMHSMNGPVDPDSDIAYDDVVRDVHNQLTERVLLAEKAGLDRGQIIVDPGLGVGKSASESFELLDRLGELRSLGCPVLVGHSHKSMFGRIDRDDDDRTEATVAATALAAERGADIVRVHDVPENVAAVDVVTAAQNP